MIIEAGLSIIGGVGQFRVGCRSQVRGHFAVDVKPVILFHLFPMEQKPQR